MNQNQLHIDPDLIAKAAKFKMSTSSGNGGQNVNRVATKATLFFPVMTNNIFNEAQKEIILQKLGNRINKEGQLIIVNQASRSALTNKKAALATLLNLLQSALKPVIKRKKVKKPKALNVKRLSDKKHQSVKKEFRKKVNLPA